MSEREDLEQAIATVEAQRAALGDAAVDAVLRELRRKLAQLEEVDRRFRPPTDEQTSGSERRVVTVLFCDVSGSTALAERMDPESWTEIMDHTFGLLTEPVDQFGGTVARLMGDAILALFGAPVAHEDDPQRAVEAALAIMENIRPYRAELRKKRGLDFNVRVGINTGLVVTGRIGSKLYEEYTALGDAANLAARMEQTAQPGTIQITEKTYSLVSTQFHCVPLGGISVKGKRKPVQAYRVIGRITQPVQDALALKAGLKSALVGRTAEFDIAQDKIGRLREGQGGILSVIGEAGVGKSRLVAEVRQNCLTESMIWLEGRTLSYGQTISYWPFKEIIWTFAGIKEEDHEDEAWQKLESKIQELFTEETSEILPFIGRLIALEVKGTFSQRIKQLDGEAVGHQIYKAARRFFERLAMTKPTILAFEDLHWADESTALLLEHILPLVERLPVLFIISSRPYRQSPLTSFREVAQRDYAGLYTELNLNPLSQVESIQLANNLLHVQHMPAAVQDLIVRRAGGNPFFLEEILRNLIDTGVVDYDEAGSRWQASVNISAIAIPDTVQGLIMARVDRLDRDGKRVLQAAAVIGRSFYYRVLEAMQPVDSSLDQYLIQLEQAELIRKKQTTQEVEYIFNHALAQEATYESILLSKRRELHARVGQAIETLFAERLEEFYGMLAYHYARSEQWEKAQDFLFKAGDKAGQVAADAEALAHYQQALAAYERAFGDEWDPLQRAVLARKMGEAHFRRGDHERALEEFQQAFRFLGRPGIPAPHLPTIFAIVVELLAQIAHRLLPGYFIKLGRTTVSPEIEEEARLHNLLGWIFLFTERERFLWASLRRLNFSEISGFGPGAAAGGAALAVVWNMIPLMKLAENYHQRANYLANQSGNLNALGITNQSIGFHELNQGNYEASNAFIRRSEEVFRRAGDLHGLGNALNLLAFNNIHMGYLYQSFEYIDELIAIGEDGADTQLVCWGNITKGVALQRLGSLEQSAAVLVEGIKMTDTLPDYYWKILGQAFLGRCYFWQGDLGSAFEALEEGDRVYKKRGIGGPALYHLRCAQTEVYLGAAEQADGKERDQLLKKGAKAYKTAANLSKNYRLFRAETERLQGIMLWLRGKPEEARESWERSLAVAGELGQHYESGLSHLEMGRRLKDQAHVQFADSLLSQMGAGWKLQKLALQENQF